MSKNDYLPTEARCHILNDEASIYMSNNWTKLTLEEQEAVVAYEAKCQARTPSIVMGLMGAVGGYWGIEEGWVRLPPTPLNRGLGIVGAGAISFYVTQYLVQMYVRYRLLKLHPYTTPSQSHHTECPPGSFDPGTGDCVDGVITGGMQTCPEGQVWDPAIKGCGPIAGQKTR
jgi:hypothetical protein